MKRKPKVDKPTEPIKPLMGILPHEEGNPSINDYDALLAWYVKKYTAQMEDMIAAARQRNAIQKAQELVSRSVALKTDDLRLFLQSHIQ